MNSALHTEHANRSMGFTSYPEAYGALKGLWEMVQWDLELYDQGKIPDDLMVKNVRAIEHRARQIVGQMKAQQ